MRDGYIHLVGHDGIRKRGTSARTFERRRNQTPNPGAFTPPELQTQAHNHVAAGHIPKGGRPDRVHRNLPKRVFDVNPTQDYSSIPTVCLTQESNPHQHIAKHAGLSARARKGEIKNDTKIGFQNGSQG